MRPAIVAIVLMITLAPAAAHAQEDAGIGDAEGEAAGSGDAGVASPEDEPPPAAAPAAPAVAQNPEPDPNDALKHDLFHLAALDQRAIVAKQRQIKLLGAAMYIEGTEYSADKDRRYVATITGGALLEVGGAAALISSFALFMSSVLGHGWGCGGEMDDEESAECREAAEKEEKGDRAGAWVLLPVGVVAVAVGIPVIIRGRRGHQRQELVRRKVEILGTAHLTGLTLTAFSSRDGPAGGFMLSGSF